ncbi:MAG: hypothetical protein QOH93_2268 [Chloroflexia bacterium]|jgi:hypothetical protein|nr:hypothetical protein [Chloroflexia bacterium]
MALSSNVKLSGGRVLRQQELGLLAALGIYPDALAGRLRLVLVIGCYADFRFTLDILSSGSVRERRDEAVQALMDLGAHCDCEVFTAIRELPRGIFRHNRSHGASQ